MESDVRPEATPTLRLWPANRGAQLLAVGFFVLLPALLGAWVYAIAPHNSDFALYYRDARVGWQYGWSHMYDLGGFNAVTRELGIHNSDPDVPSLSVPLLTWLVAPYALLPFPIAYIAWMATILSAAMLTWRLLAPRVPFGPWPHLLLAAVFLPLVWGITEGSGLVIAVLAIAAAWWLLQRDRPLVAGLVLCLALVRPQVWVLIPICLLAAGRRRFFAAVVAGGALLSLLVLLVVPIPELQAYAGRVMGAAQHPRTWQVASELSLASVRPLLLAAPLLVAVAAVAIVASYQARRSPNRDAIAMISGIVGSLLIAPYLHIPDLALLLVAVWLALRLAPSRWWPAVVLPAAFAANLEVSIHSALPAVLEIAWLLAVAFVPHLLEVAFLPVFRRLPTQPAQQ
jgi:hypothetical protein